MPTVVVTGASRGIGLEFVRQYLEDGWTVHAGARDLAGSGMLKALACDRLHVHALDLRNRDQIAALGQLLSGQPVDVLINNAGLWFGDDEAMGRCSDDAWIEEFEVHVFAVMAMTEALVENISASENRLIVNISSGNGSFGWEAKATDYPYNSTKAALNMLTWGLSLDLADRGISVLAFTPGFVATDMTDHASDLKPSESVAGMREMIAEAGLEQSGSFRRYNREAMPW
ncbi:MAG: short-chain dehydrogenase [Rhodospirillaceae bacterium]|nr:short-chain dehydrogenase [Rhodospirillaceae bacterium]|tara:strand:- start:3166 stop:3852 length:687 start_codon:yes stop_codon:yes gene_type:complete